MRFPALGSRGPLWRATVGISSWGTLSALHSLDFPVLPYANHRGGGSLPLAAQPLGKKSYFKHVLFLPECSLKATNSCKPSLPGGAAGPQRLDLCSHEGRQACPRLGMSRWHTLTKAGALRLKGYRVGVGSSRWSFPKGFQDFKAFPSLITEHGARITVGSKGHKDGAGNFS